MSEDMSKQTWKNQVEYQTENDYKITLSSQKSVIINSADIKELRKILKKLDKELKYYV